MLLGGEQVSKIQSEVCTSNEQRQLLKLQDLQEISEGSRVPGSSKTSQKLLEIQESQESPSRVEEEVFR